MSQRIQKWMLFAAMFSSGFCGMVAEYSVGTTVSYLIGNSIAAYTVTISVFMFAMGIGALISRSFPEGKELRLFLFIECMLSIAAGGSTILITQAARIELAWVATVAIAFFIGLLIGFEIPLLTRFNEKRKVVLKDNLAFIFAADYLGSFLAGMSYSIFLLPKLGTVNTPIFSGVINLVIVIAMAAVFAKEVSWRHLGLPLAFSGLTLFLLAMHGEDVAFAAEQRSYKDPIVYAEQSSYQRILITEMKGHHCLYLNGGQQFCTTDERRYHEMLVHPACWIKQRPQTVLILGGGDGLAVREILKYDSVEKITVVDLDPRVVEIARSFPAFKALNEGALDDPRLKVVNEDAYTWLKTNDEVWDIILIDLPDPRQIEMAKLYSLEFYSNVKDHLSPDGAVALQSTSPIHSTEAYVTIWATLQAAGLSVVPYRINVPSFGDWGFQLGVRKALMSHEQLLERLDAFEEQVPLEVLNRAAIQAATRFEKGILPIDPSDIPISRLLDPVIHEAYKNAWKGIQ
jgi:spermidine synthase